MEVKLLYLRPLVVLTILLFLGIVFIVYKIKANTCSVFEPTGYGEDRFVEISGYLIHYIEVGTGEPLLLIPGSFSTYRVWNRIIPYLSDDFRIIAVDYVGAGASDKPKSGFHYTIDEQADIAAAMIQELKMGPVNIAGASYGGVIVLNLATRYPNLVRKAISIEGSVVKPDELPAIPFEALLKYPLLGDLFIGVIKTGLLNKIVLKLVMGEWYSQMTEAEKKEELSRLKYNAGSAHRIAWYWISISHKTCRDFTEEAKTIAAPVLYLYGEKSDFGDMIQENIQFFETYLPHVKVTGLADGIHDLQTQKPHETAALILEFLQ